MIKKMFLKIKILLALPFVSLFSMGLLGDVSIINHQFNVKNGGELILNMVNASVLITKGRVANEVKIKTTVKVQKKSI